MTDDDRREAAEYAKDARDALAEAANELYDVECQLRAARRALADACEELRMLRTCFEDGGDAE